MYAQRNSWLSVLLNEGKIDYRGRLQITALSLSDIVLHFALLEHRLLLL